MTDYKYILHYYDTGGYVKLNMRNEPVKTESLWHAQKWASLETVTQVANAVVSQTGPLTIFSVSVEPGAVFGIIHPTKENGNV